MAIEKFIIVKYLSTDNFLNSAIIILAPRILPVAPAGRECYRGPHSLYNGPPGLLLPGLLRTRAVTYSPSHYANDR